jgi:hypothetical protein
MPSLFNRFSDRFSRNYLRKSNNSLDGSVYSSSPNSSPRTSNATDRLSDNSGSKKSTNMDDLYTNRDDFIDENPLVHQPSIHQPGISKLTAKKRSNIQNPAPYTRKIHNYSRSDVNYSPRNNRHTVKLKPNQPNYNEYKKFLGIKDEPTEPTEPTEPIEPIEPTESNETQEENEMRENHTGGLKTKKRKMKKHKTKKHKRSKRKAKVGGNIIPNTIAYLVEDIVNKNPKIHQWSIDKAPDIKIMFRKANNIRLVEQLGINWGRITNIEYINPPNHNIFILQDGVVYNTNFEPTNIELKEVYIYIKLVNGPLFLYKEDRTKGGGHREIIGNLNKAILTTEKGEIIENPIILFCKVAGELVFEGEPENYNVKHWNCHSGTFKPKCAIKNTTKTKPIYTNIDELPANKYIPSGYGEIIDETNDSGNMSGRTDKSDQSEDLEENDLTAMSNKTDLISMSNKNDLTSMSNKTVKF